MKHPPEKKKKKQRWEPTGFQLIFMSIFTEDALMQKRNTLVHLQKKKT